MQPELALRCAEFFSSLSDYCLQYYHSCNIPSYVDREEKERKTKMIKKNHKKNRPKYKSKLENENDQN